MIISPFVVSSQNQVCSFCHSPTKYSQFKSGFSKLTPTNKLLSKSCPVCQPLVIGHQKSSSGSVFSKLPLFSKKSSLKFDDSCCGSL